MMLRSMRQHPALVAAFGVASALAVGLGYWLFSVIRADRAAKKPEDQV
jgi:hypothetical protein